MDKLYAPWRSNYVQSGFIKKNPADKANCIFCEIFSDDYKNEDRFVLYRDDKIAVLLNLYPYNGGHLLVIPKNHEEQFFELGKEIEEKLISAASKSMKILKKELNCDGINFGANVGSAAGAGIPKHIHMHLVPRWNGDTGFFSVIGETKQISVDLKKIYEQLKAAFDKEFSG